MHNRINSLTTRSTFDNKGLFKIYYIDTTGKADWQDARLFSKNLTTVFNDGPATFNKSGDTVYFSRNLDVKTKLTDVSSPRNKLGIFSAVLVDKQWMKVRELRINNEYYNVTTPYLSRDGKRLFFASDKPGGYGGSDLYYSQWENDRWEDPVNLGPNINTRGNEAYPFINPAGELFFSSDSLPGLGGKDIFFSRFDGTGWTTPVHIDAPINSQYDDFGMITDTLMNEGYFSSNRGKSIDIFHFRTNFHQVFYNNFQRENKCCFIFSDSGSIVVDTIDLEYVWDFGNGEKSSGAIVSHCFPASGNYNIRLDIIERSTGKLFFAKLAYNMDLRNIEQPYINSPDVSFREDLIEFDGQKSYLPGFKILNYSWDFGDKSRSSGEKASHSFTEKGVYIVNLELTLKSDTTGYIHKAGVSKKIVVFNDKQERDNFLTMTSSDKPEIIDIRKYSDAFIKTKYDAESGLKKDVVFCTELLSSKNRIDINSSVFRGVPKNYVVKERFDPDNGIYCYTVDQQMSLMATLPAYKKMQELGFNDARIKMFVLTNPAEMELHNLIKRYSDLTDSYFDKSEMLTSQAYIMLDQIVKLMNKYPSVKLEIAVHSDNTGSEEANLELSQKRSQLLVDYLVNRGVNINKLVPTGVGSSKPVASNLSEKDRKLNRRVEFIITNL